MDVIDEVIDTIRRSRTSETAEKNLLPLQPGDVPDTWADTEELGKDVGYQPSTPVEEGVRKFIDWYLEFYDIEH